MRRLLAVLLCSALVAAACSDDDTETLPTSGEAPDTTVAPPTTTPPTTAAPADPVAVTPVVVCVRSDATVGPSDFATFFAYESDGTEPVELAESTLDGAIPDDDPFVPTLVAPGRVSPAFYAFAAGDEALTWTVVGPDGESRTATAGPDTPPCTDELLAPSTGDSRTPALEVTRAEVSADGSSLTVDVALTGVPDLSVCPEGLMAEPVSVRMDDFQLGGLVEGATFSLTSPLFDQADGPGQQTTIPVAALVVDQCGDGDTVQGSWPNGPFESIRDGDLVCATVVDGEVAIEIVTFGGCPGGLPPTGGGRIRG
ncbi:MAG TPA: hypothetical protein VK866_05990 [Acidimicrobiales bacterium]|nr:hypothetical protein [Acidimicrobiales bacterium]